VSVSLIISTGSPSSVDSSSLGPFFAILQLKLLIKSNPDKSPNSRFHIFIKYMFFCKWSDVGKLFSGRTCLIKKALAISQRWAK
jgi:hypothetical protein